MIKLNLSSVFYNIEILVGLDFKQVFLKMGPELADLDVARKAKVISTSLRSFQKSITSIELCKKPVLTAIHSACVGGGLNLIAAADIRYCSKDAWFQLKEVSIYLCKGFLVLFS